MYHTTLSTTSISATRRIRIVPDYEAEAPDTFGRIAYVSTSWYQLGNLPCPRSQLDTIKNSIASGKLIGMPVYAYIHSAVVLDTAPFHCPWDSGQCGFIHVTPASVRDAFGVKRISAKLRARVQESLRDDVKTFSSWLSGDSCGFVIEDLNLTTNEWEYVESAFGYLDQTLCLQDARDVAAPTPPTV